jgi:DNA excision repair protein ERCC-8
MKALISTPSIRAPDKCVTSLDVHKLDCRYLLSGSMEGIVSVYDLSRWGASPLGKTGSEQHELVHQPIARSFIATATGQQSCEVPRGHSLAILSALWYPLDSGMFLSASTDGHVLLWDTNEMTPVTRLAPFEFENTSMGEEVFARPSCMEISLWSGNLAALGSRRVNAVKLVDIRTGTSSHSLTGHRAGISTVQWCPTAEHVLASGGQDGCIRIWDIRKAGSTGCLTTLDRDACQEPSVSNRFKADYSHLKITKQKLAPNDYHLAESKSIWSVEGSVTGLAFTPDGHSIVSTSSDGQMQLWDLRGPASMAPQRFTNSVGGRPLAKSKSTTHRRPLLITKNGNSSTVWVPNGRVLLGFSLEDDGSPTQILSGHLQGIQAIAEVPDTGEIITSSTDRLILTWGYPQPLHTFASSRKRRLEDDRDSW